MQISATYGNLATLPEHRAVSRRRFLLASAGAFATLPVLLSACATPTTSGPAAQPPTPGPVSPSGSRATFQLPTYLPIQGAKPDLPGTAAGLDPGYTTFPQNLIKSVANTPGQGGDVTVMTRLLVAPPPAFDQNPAWQEINRQLGANLKMTMVPNIEYPTKFATTVAGGDIPDLLHIPSQLPFQGLPQFLQSACADLSPYLSGDAIKDYPNLANIPTLAWKQTVYNGRIYGVAIPRPFVQTIWYVNQDRLDRIGATQPHNADDFKRILQQLTQPAAGQWGTSSETSTALGLLGVPPSVPLPAMFRSPNNWRQNTDGTFTKDIETEEFRAALGYLRDLYAAGVYHPDTPTTTTAANKQGMVGGKFGVYQDGFFSYPTEYWDAGLKQNPPIRFRTFHPFSHDGAKPIWHQYGAFFGMTAVKKASPERIREMLRILDYTAAPFGSQEAFLLEYGIAGVDHILDAAGRPTLTDQGRADTSVSWRYMTMRPQVLFDANDPTFAKVAQADEETIIPIIIPDPSLGLFSETNQYKGPVILGTVTTGVTEIALGRRPLSDFDQVVKEWRTAGGDQIRTDLQKAAAAAPN